MVVGMLCLSVFKTDFTRLLVRLAAISQLVAGIFLISSGTMTSGTGSPMPLTFDLPVSEWEIGILFQYHPTRLYFLGAYLVPLLFGLFRPDHLPSKHFRLVFLLYLTGASGLIVTGDFFNFFVFYELMIMGAYILISIKGSHWASIKYMIIGSISSILLLAGIAVLYSGGAPFRMAPDESLYLVSSPQIQLAMLLFSLAFFIKAAFFPASGWVATCHGAANGLVSAFLASFTIFSGILGLHLFVVVPSVHLGLEAPLLLIRAFSLLTIAISAIILFFEPKFKRTIAASTILTSGLTGLLLSCNRADLAFSLVLMHALYKTMLFHATEELSSNRQTIHGSWPTLFLAGLGLFLLLGLFPAPGWHLKTEFLLHFPEYKGIFFFFAFFLVAGFAKFHVGVLSPFDDVRRPFAMLLTGLLLTGMAIGIRYLALDPTHSPLPDWTSALQDAGVLAGGFLFGRLAFPKTCHLHALDKRAFFPNINRELLLILLMILAGLLHTYR